MNVGSVGDCTYILGVINELRKRGEDVIVRMPKGPQCERVSLIYKNLAKVEFVDNPLEAIYKIKGDTSKHASQRASDYLGITNVSAIPKILLDDDEIDWARTFLKQYTNPVVVVNDNGGSSTPGNFAAQYRRPPSEVMQVYVDKLIQLSYTILQFGIKDLKDRDNAFTPLNNALSIRGLDIRQTSACYYVIGKYVGGDTGDYHLMLACGGKTITLIPPEDSIRYSYSDLLYTDDLWKNEKIRCKYVNYTTPELGYKYLSFDF